MFLAQRLLHFWHFCVLLYNQSYLDVREMLRCFGKGLGRGEGWRQLLDRQIVCRLDAPRALLSGHQLLQPDAWCLMPARGEACFHFPRNAPQPPDLLETRLGSGTGRQTWKQQDAGINFVWCVKLLGQSHHNRSRFTPKSSLIIFMWIILFYFQKYLHIYIFGTFMLSK